MTHRLQGDSGLMCYPLKHNIAYFPFFIDEMHILSNNRLIETNIAKKVPTQIEINENNHFEFF